MRSQKRFLKYLFAIAIVLSSCKTAKILKTTSETAHKVVALSAKKVIANHYSNTFRFESLKARIKAGYDDGNKKANLTVGLRMEKDKRIWLSAKYGGFIVVAKALITPSKVQYYEVVNNTYFDGDFTLLSKWLGTALDFEKVQNLLLGQALFDLKKEKYTNSVKNSHYLLAPKKQLALFERLFTIRTDNFKLQAQRIAQKSKDKAVLVEYPEYDTVGNQSFPKKIAIKASQPGKRSKIAMEYKDVEYNAKVSFPFTIPSGAKQITIK